MKKKLSLVMSLVMTVAIIASAQVFAFDLPYVCAPATATQPEWHGCDPENGRPCKIDEAHETPPPMQTNPAPIETREPTSTTSAEETTTSPETTTATPPPETTSTTPPSTTTPPEPPAHNCYAKGDIDNNGKVDIQDALQVLMYLARMYDNVEIDTNWKAFCAASITFNPYEDETSFPTIQDALQILMYCARMDNKIGTPWKN